MAVGLSVRKPGLMTTVQDGGRVGYLGLGFAPSGAMDQRAYRLANILLGNGPNACVLEFALAGPELACTSDAVIALTGADFHAELNGRTAPRYQAFSVRQGDTLYLPAANGGVFGYLAVAGSFQLPQVLGSCSTNLKAGIGGLEGRALRPGDELHFCSESMDGLTGLGQRRLEPEAYTAPGAGPVLLRAVPGPQDRLFSERGIRTFYGEAYTVSALSDRMGYRMQGPEVETISGSDIISDAVASGAVQITANGSPIVMLADRPTTGGYAKIATVASVDIPKLVQCPPGTQLRFQAISVQEAQQLYRSEQLEYQQLREQLNKGELRIEN